MDWIRRLNYPRWAIINFIVLTLLGLVLRYIQLYGLSHVDYQFILHAHSHFAFAGWMFFAIALLISHIINGPKYTRSYLGVFALTIISAYGMLVSFSLQGYRPVSIIFSTLFVCVTFRFTYLVFRGKALKNAVNPVAYQLIRAALIFLCLSALGPFTLGPLTALGLKNTPYYQDAIYFYLHFQLNGFMFLGALGLAAASYLTIPLAAKSTKWLNLFIYSAIPLYSIFTLWDNPNGYTRILAGLGAGLNLLGWVMLLLHLRKQVTTLPLLVKAAIIAATLKVIFQALICIPSVGSWTFLNRNLIIGYIHLLTLGIIMPLIIDQFIKHGFLKDTRPLNIVGRCYIILVIAYLALLFLQPLLALFSVTLPQYQLLLFILSLLFLPVGLMLLVRVNKAP
jgi:hypothetical protein